MEAKREALSPRSTRSAREARLGIRGRGLRVSVEGGFVTTFSFYEVFFGTRHVCGFDARVHVPEGLSIECINHDT